MLLGEVVGSVTASVKDASLAGVKLLLVRLPEGKTVAAADAAHVAGRGDAVYLLTSKEAAQSLQNGRTPVDLAIAGIADSREWPGA